MKPMNSKTLDGILDKLARIGAKKVQKNKTMLSSINLQDDMIKIAAKQVVLDPIEKKLRTGYIHPVSTQFTHLPPKAKDVKKKPGSPSSAMSKYPSGSETTTPYVGEQHGGDQVPAASTLAHKKIASTADYYDIRDQVRKDIPDASDDELHVETMKRWDVYKNEQGELKRQIKEKEQQKAKDLAEERGISLEEANAILDNEYISKIIDEMKEKREYEEGLEGHASLNPKGMRVFASAKIKEVINDLKTEGIGYIEVKDVVMRLSQKGVQSGFNIQEMCQTLCNEGITLMRFAAEQLVETDAPVPPQPEEYGEALTVGTQIEMEHKDTIDAMRNQLEQGNDLPDEKIAEMIATDHLKENPAYYDPLMGKGAEDLGRGQGGPGRGGEPKTDEERAETHGVPVEDLPPRGTGRGMPGKGLQQGFRGGSDEHGFEITAKSVSEIKDDLESARKSRSYAIERMQEKGLEKNEKERYQKTKKKWEKTIDRLDRELGRAMKKERKDERDLEKAKKEEDAMTGEQAGERAVGEDKVASLQKKGFEQEDRVELVNTTDPYTKLQPGDQGTVQSVDDSGTVHVVWDSGENLGMVPEAGDEIKLVDEGIVQGKVEGTVVTAQEPLADPTFELEKFLSPAEYQEVQRVIDLRQKAWGDISNREERNIQEGLEPYANIDYSEVEVLNTKIKEYQELSKSRELGNELPATPEQEAPMAPAPSEEEFPEAEEFSKGKSPAMPGAPEEGVLTKRPEELPMFASRKKGMTRKAVTSQDFPDICKNCKSLVVPAGYNELTFLDHKVKPYCSVSDSSQNIGFRWAYCRDCRGYDAIVKEVSQATETPTESYSEVAKDKGQQSILDKKASKDGYEDSPNNKKELLGETAEQAKERGMKICPKCVEAGYFVPAGEFNQVHDWHSLWNIAFTDVAHDPKGVCMPRSLAMQSQPEGGPNQFDTEKNRIVTEEKK